VRPVSTTPGAIETALTREFATARPRIFIEPGRYLVGDAGLLRTEVLLISQKSLHERDRWVFLQGPKMSVQRWRIESYGLGDFARPPRLVPQQLDDPA
jgi:diaminopimelate decarboxylase